MVFVALSVEPNIGSEALAAYAADTGYDLMFAAMPPEMLQALATPAGDAALRDPARWRDRRPGDGYQVDGGNPGTGGRARLNV